TFSASATVRPALQFREALVGVGQDADNVASKAHAEATVAGEQRVDRAGVGGGKIHIAGHSRDPASPQNRTSVVFACAVKLTSRYWRRPSHAAARGATCRTRAELRSVLSRSRRIAGLR